MGPVELIGLLAAVAQIAGQVTGAVDALREASSEAKALRAVVEEVSWAVQVVLETLGRSKSHGVAEVGGAGAGEGPIEVPESTVQAVEKLQGALDHARSLLGDTAAAAAGAASAAGVAGADGGAGVSQGQEPNAHGKGNKGRKSKWFKMPKAAPTVAKAWELRSAEVRISSALNCLLLHISLQSLIKANKTGSATQNQETADGSQTTAFVPIKEFAYEVLRVATQNFGDVIGQGEYGTVYRGQAPRSRPGPARQEWAVKRWRERDGAACGEGRRRMRAELLLVRAVAHPNLARLLGYCSHKEEIILVYEYCPLGDLATALHGAGEKGGKRNLSLDERARLAIGVGEAVAFLHGLKPHVVHRDIKPANVFLRSSPSSSSLAVDSAVLGDFGFARQVLPFDSVSASSGVGGTHGYVDWEAVKHGQDRTPPADVYSFGVLLLELFSGRQVYSLAGSQTNANASWHGGGCAGEHITCLAERAQQYDCLMDLIVWGPHAGDAVVACTMLKIGLLCVGPVCSRPTMEEVLLQMKLAVRSRGFPAAPGTASPGLVTSSTSRPSKSENLLQGSFSFASSSLTAASPDTHQDSFLMPNSPNQMDRRSLSYQYVIAPRHGLQHATSWSASNYYQNPTVFYPPVPGPNSVRYSQSSGHEHSPAPR